VALGTRNLHSNTSPNQAQDINRNIPQSPSQHSSRVGWEELRVTQPTLYYEERSAKKCYSYWKSPGLKQKPGFFYENTSQQPLAAVEKPGFLSWCAQVQIPIEH